MKGKKLLISLLTVALSMMTLTGAFAEEKKDKLDASGAEKRFWEAFNKWSEETQIKPLKEREKEKNNSGDVSTYVVPGSDGSSFSLGTDTAIYYTTTGNKTTTRQYNATVGASYSISASSGGDLTGWGSTGGLGYAEVNTWVGPEFSISGSGSQGAYISFYGSRYGAMLGSGTSTYEIRAYVKDLTTNSIIGQTKIDGATLTGSQTLRNYEGDFGTYAIFATLEAGHRYYAYLRFNGTADSNSNIASSFSFDPDQYPYGGSNGGVHLDKAYLDFK